ncbi:PfkB family carbohydrate kinase [Limosilactobacillus mucosae]|uniref:PfkB family carbohydrate kinase n=1 Tax=Limosilactobacillus mucosae TaxID=97478 RepID=A0AAJ1HMT4_LIMMU|nr:PfkB family carbohydrate kinase [Limosilactobacillus mucosae]MDC2826953.1 PfkB family carbohydrate kinase [Limosilactobacillus mucosae]MDC2834652.1 PfkB family carbohydrate kinase [Limosilactobacillus mucosae]
MPTEREKQILDLIRQNPMISQKELAEKLGITRPGVASHISRLIKEGLILGKGYVLPKKEYVTVIGAVNMDIYGIVSDYPVVLKGSNTGHVTTQLGGLGRNIAANAAALGLDTNLITVFGSDDYGTRFKEDAYRRGIDISYSKQLPDRKTSVYLYVNQGDGERIIGVDDMRINEFITPRFLEPRLAGINAGKAAIIDSNLPAETIRWLYDNVRVPMYAKAVSVTKTPRLLQDNLNLEGLVINGVEGSFMASVKIMDINDGKECAEKLYDIFKTRIYLYLDQMGMIMADRDGTLYHGYEPGLRVENTNGVGASMTAALAYAQLRHESLDDTLDLMIRIGGLTMATGKSVSDRVGTLLENE